MDRHPAVAAGADRLGQRVSLTGADLAVERALEYQHRLSHQPRRLERLVVAEPPEPGRRRQGIGPDLTLGLGQPLGPHLGREIRRGTDGPQDLVQQDLRPVLARARQQDQRSEGTFLRAEQRRDQAPLAVADQGDAAGIDVPPPAQPADLRPGVFGEVGRGGRVGPAAAGPGAAIVAAQGGDPGGAQPLGDLAEQAIVAEQRPEVLVPRLEAGAGDRDRDGEGGPTGAGPGEGAPEREGVGRDPRRNADLGRRPRGACRGGIVRRRPCEAGKCRKRIGRTGEHCPDALRRDGEFAHRTARASAARISSPANSIRTESAEKRRVTGMRVSGPATSTGTVVSRPANCRTNSTKLNVVCGGSTSAAGPGRIRSRVVRPSCAVMCRESPAGTTE